MSANIKNLKEGKPKVAPFGFSLFSSLAFGSFGFSLSIRKVFCRMNRQKTLIKFKMQRKYFATDGSASHLSARCNFSLRSSKEPYKRYYPLSTGGSKNFKNHHEQRSGLHLSAVWIFFLKRGRSGTKGTAPEHLPAGRQAGSKKFKMAKEHQRVLSFAQKQSGVARSAEGFTLTELTISMGLMSLAGITLLAVFTTFIVATTRTNYTIEMTNDSQNLLRVVVEELRYGAGVRQTNSISDPNGPAGGWNTGNTNFVIITAVPAESSSNQYIIDPLTGEPYFNEYVYYKNGETLMKRTLANPGATGNSSKTSCPVATGGCPADRKLVEGLDYMVFSLYDQDNNSTTDPLLARSVKIDLRLQKDSFGTPLSFDNSIRVTLRNTF